MHACVRVCFFSNLSFVVSVSLWFQIRIETFMHITHIPHWALTRQIESCFWFLGKWATAVMLLEEVNKIVWDSLEWFSGDWGLVHKEAGTRLFVFTIVGRVFCFFWFFLEIQIGFLSTRKRKIWRYLKNYSFTSRMMIFTNLCCTVCMLVSVCLFWWTKWSKLPSLRLSSWLANSNKSGKQTTRLKLEQSESVGELQTWGTLVNRTNRLSQSRVCSWQKYLGEGRAVTPQPRTFGGQKETLHVCPDECVEGSSDAGSSRRIQAAKWKPPFDNQPRTQKLMHGDALSPGEETAVGAFN